MSHDPTRFPWDNLIAFGGLGLYCFVAGFLSAYMIWGFKGFEP